MSKPSLAAESAPSLDLYLKEIARYPLLSREEETRLARRVQAGDEAAVEHLARANLRFVVSVAKRFQHQGLSMADLIAEGNRGLLRSIPKFDPDNGARFISYARWWIVQAIQSALHEALIVPPGIGSKVQRIRRKAAKFARHHGIRPSAAELAEQLGESVNEVADALASAFARSLNEPAAPGGKGSLADRIGDPEARLPIDEMHLRERAALIRKAVGTLPEREAQFINLYYGLDGGEPMTMQEIADLVGRSRARVQQVLKSAVTRLQDPSLARRLEDCL